MRGSGVIHLLSGPTPAAVSKQLMEEIIGRVQLPPFWSLGFHLCRESDESEAFQDILQKMVTFIYSLGLLRDFFFLSAQT